MDYADFSIKVEPKRGDVYPVIVLHSPAGEARSELSLPFDPDQIGTILSDLHATVRASHGPSPTRDVSPGAVRTLPQQIGDQLFTALFTGPIRSLLDQSLGMIHGRQRGLRIKLHIDPEDPSLAQLVSLPWEFLYRKETRDFLNLSRFTPVLRYLDVQRPYAPLLLAPPLRVLVVLANPHDCRPLDLQRERNLIENSIARLEGIRVEFMERATIYALQERLADQPYHVLHYMGHGGFDEQSGSGVLLLQDEAGYGDTIDGSTLGMVLRDVPSMQLVFLNACETARVSKERGLDPFAGVASSMVMAGVPAVVAMQFPITDTAAITFSRRFYALLARGEPVDGAVAEGRRAIRVAEPESMEWGTPVLYMRAPQGIIFQLTEDQKAKLVAQSIEEPSEAKEAGQEKRLAELYHEGLAAFWLEEWDQAVRSFQAIVNLRPDYQDSLTKLEHSKRQRYLSIVYSRGEAARDAEDWPAAAAAWEELVQLQPDYRDARNLLQEALCNKQLADLYAEARQLTEAQQWQAVMNVFSQISALHRDYPDPDGLLPEAERQVAELRRQAELDGVFVQALRAMDAGQWQEAHELLARVQAAEPDYRGSDRLLEKAEAAIAQQEAERRKQERIATLYEQALGLARAGQWRQVRAKLAEIDALDPKAVHPEGLAERANSEIAREEAETQRQNELASLYAEAVRLIKVEQYQAALEKWNEVRAREPRYPDRQKVQATAHRRLNELARSATARDATAGAPTGSAPPARRRARTWAKVGAVGLMIAAAAGIWLAGRGPLSWAPSILAPAARPLGATIPTATVELSRAVALVPTIEPSPSRQLEAVKKIPTATVGRSGAVALVPTIEPSPSRRAEATKPIPTQTATVPPCRNGVLYCEDFEDGLAQDWEFTDAYRRPTQAGWKLVQEGGNRLIAGRGHNFASLLNHTWNDYRVRFRLRLIQGTVHLSYRHSADAEGHIRYFIGFHEGGLYVTREVHGTFTDLTSVEARHALDRWYEVEIAGWGGHLQLSVDGKVELDYTDPNPLRNGSIAFETQDDSSAEVDDIEVTGAGAEPTPRPAPSCGPTVLYCEDFDDGLAQDWVFWDARGAPSSGWKVNREGGNYDLMGEGHQWAVLENHSWDDYRVRFRLKLRQGAIHLNYRLAEASRYFVGFDQQQLTLSWQRGEVISDGTSTQAGRDLNRWYLVEIVGRGGRIQVFVDGELELDYTDRNPLLQGTIAFETLEESSAEVDDIEVLPASS